MPRKKANRFRNRRFSVSLPDSDYRRLRTVVRKSRPRVSMTVVVNSAIQQFLDDRPNGKIEIKIGDRNGVKNL
jgi:Arc/MetJ-type ribon-helix-helix transcriptional regulator